MSNLFLVNQFILLIFIASSCSSAHLPNNLKQVQVNDQSLTDSSKTMIDIAKNKVVGNGKMIILEQALENPFLPGDSVFCNGKKVVAYPVDETMSRIQYFVHAGYYTVAPKKISCFIQSQSSSGLSEKVGLNAVKLGDIEVVDFPYLEEKLSVDQKKVDLSKKDLARVEREQAMLNKIYIASSEILLFHKPFILPIDSFRTSIYGNRRIFNKSQMSTHLGNDFRAAIGTPVPVSNRGKVVYVGDLFFSGKTVIVDHGLGLFTMYAHLKSISVTQTALINQGDILGLSGATGRVSGPHLHWGVKISGDWIDGTEVVSQTNQFLKIYENRSTELSVKENVKDKKIKTF